MPLEGSRCQLPHPSPNSPSRVSSPPLLSPTRAPVPSAEPLGVREEEPVSHLLSCQPRQHLVFLKTHKTASSTLINILHRFGDTRSLRFALPAGYQFSYPRLFQARHVKGWRPSGPPFDILCHHMRFNLLEVGGSSRKQPGWVQEEGCGKEGRGGTGGERLRLFLWGAFVSCCKQPGASPTSGWGREASHLPRCC